MGRRAANSENNGAATRGRIVQRVLVDGWSTAQAAVVFDVRERDVVRWLAAYRRRGMASLRDEVTAQPAPWRWVRRLVLALRRIATAPEASPSSAELAPLVPLRHRSIHRRRR